ncbi:cytochrome c biogenesis protein ResB [Desulfotalea psychrophila]|uniref:Related to cytochrome c-type forming protein Ccs1 n=1 Tax=Desulfotalea psychrophila (strain LSv54 / DSM 12343) TaxID=177439 RepID=Q6AML4_DESPS|nr:cytochrome c biogenesis protein ResB [Desulfotalea psychrophila]CAG36411.1 related to cytochrome c-type forming protein Ccs1 [Desulfotalea psychrophila LSv54]
MKSTNPLWKFLASVQLAIFIFFALASTSVIGTVIPQHRPMAFYLEAYGNFWTQIFLVLDIPEMYSSWWFTGLLCLLALNLIICTIDRFPITLRRIRATNGSFSREKIEAMPFCQSFQLPKRTAQQPQRILAKLGWPGQNFNRESYQLFFSQKSLWSHLGVYVVHISILVIFVGAMIGNIAGYKGSVMIAEGGATREIYSQDKSGPIPLGFELACDSFAIEYYDTGMPKTYRSHLTISENGKETLSQEIEVNSPLHYKGLTFYQASYEGFQTFMLKIKRSDTGNEQAFKLDFQEQEEWQEEGLQLGVINVIATDKHVERIKLWIFDGKSKPQTIWFDNNQTIKTTGLNATYEISAKQMYATGLQVTKDPGVWCVYLGCILLIIGLYISFFTSHRKIWLIIDQNKRITLAGFTAKNKAGFNKEFNKITRCLQTLEQDKQ